MRTLPVSGDLLSCPEELIESMPDDSPANSKLREVLHLKLLRSDTSTGPEGISVKFVKMVPQSIAGPFTTIINNCIREYYFPKRGKMWELVQFLKSINRSVRDTFVPFQISPHYQKSLRNLSRCRWPSFVNLNQYSAIQFLAFVRDTRPIQC